MAANFLGSAQANYYRAFNLGSVEVYDPYADAYTNGGWQVIALYILTLSTHHHHHWPTHYIQTLYLLTN